MRRLRRLIQKRSLRWSEQVCVLEGPDLINAALESGAEFEAVFADASSLTQPNVAEVLTRCEDAGVRVFALEAGVLQKVADAVTPQPLLAAVRLPLTPLSELSLGSTVLILHDVRDPGNAGTIIRSADASGSAGVIFTGQSVDPFNPKTLRATAGSVFNIPISVGNFDEVVNLLHSHQVQTVASVVRGGKNYRSIDFTKPSAIVIGNEADGLDEESVACCQIQATIPMAGKNESLNAGIAGALLAFEAMNQRLDASGSSPAPSL